MTEREEPAPLHAAYRTELARTLRRRLDLAAALFLLFVGGAVVLEAFYHPDRAGALVRFYGLELVTCMMAALACRLPALRLRTGSVGALLAGALAAEMSGYNAAVGGVAERLAMGHVCLLSGIFVLLPWHWSGQLVVSFVALASYVMATPYLVPNDSLAYGTLAIVTAATTSVCGAYFLERYRYDAFRRAALQTEEAEIAAALVHVGQVLGAHLDQPDMLDHVTRVAVETIGCDWTSIFIWDDRQQAFHLGANVGSPPEVRAELAQVEFPLSRFPLLAAFRPGELIELADAAQQSLVPMELLHRWGQASALYAPIARAEAIVGVLVHGFTTRTGPFSAKQRRLALGIANATAIALENARLINDLQTAGRIKSEFVSTMSHELRTPLHVIMGYTDMLEELDDAERADAISKIRRTSRELLELIEATLDLNRLESGRDAPRLEALPIRPLWEELASEFRALARPGVTLRFDPVDDLRLCTDRRKLKIIVKNLVGNALKFTRAGEVVASCRRDGASCRITVRDTGVGIASEQLPHIFEMFRQVDSSDSRSHGGVGLGLYIVRRLVDQLRGDVRVQSEPGIGSIFVVTLPLGEVARQGREPVTATG